METPDYRTMADLEREARDEGRPWPPPFPGGAERPDPLAPPEGYGVRPEDAVKPVLDVCAVITSTGGEHCKGEVVVIAWVGCTRGEHAGPVTYCADHQGFSIQILEAGMAVCGSCLDGGADYATAGRAKVLKVEFPRGIFMTEGADDDASKDH